MPEAISVSRPSFAFCSIALLMSLAAHAQQPASSQAPASDPGPKIDWHKGPYTAKLGVIAELKVPEGYEFADGVGARIYLERTGNPPSNTEIGIITPISEDKADDWVMLFDFDETGYVKDNEKSSIDADSLLDSMKKGTEEDNQERKKKGWTPFHITGWQTQPFYDDATHNLVWGTTGNSDKSKDDVTINYATRILGRRGVLRTDLVMDPTQVTNTVPKAKSLLAGVVFSNGNRYADFVQGDKVAEYGLTALIAGGATAVAIKTGLFAKLLAMLAGLWKLIVVAFAALMSRIKNITAAVKKKFGRKTGFKNDEDESSTQP